MKFSGIINHFEKNALAWHIHIPIPADIFQKMLIDSPNKRIICNLNNSHVFHCAMLPKGVFHYILLNTEICKKLQLKPNDTVMVEIEADKTKYGINISEEMLAVLDSDDVGKILFEKLSPGILRSTIYLLNKVKNPQSRIEKTFVVLDHLKRNKGVLNFKILNEDFKNNTNNLRF